MRSIYGKECFINLPILIITKIIYTLINFDNLRIYFLICFVKFKKFQNLIDFSRNIPGLNSTYFKIN